MPSAKVNGIDLYYETTGDESDPPLLLICGLGMQLIGWGADFLGALAANGYFVIAFDNRDAGLSTYLVGSGVPNLLALLEGGEANIAYHLSDMADDAAGLLEALGLQSVHVLGVSMGGMIAQQLAISHPAIVRSLTSIMSTTGDPSVGQPSQAAAEALLQLNSTSREEAIELSIVVLGILGSPAFPPDEERTRRMAGEAYDRSNEPTGIARQMGAIIASPDRTAGLRALAVPTLVIHGSADPLVNPSGGRATAAAVPGAKLTMIEGMGHELPTQIWDQVLAEVDAIAREGEAQRAAHLASSSS